MLIIMLRISGKRTLSKMNAFDFIVTIALGSMLSSVILNKDTPLAEGLLAIGLLILMQYLFSMLSVRSTKFKALISNPPVVLYYRGQFFDEILKKERIAQSQINQSIRGAGFADITAIEAIVLESTGDLSVISKADQVKRRSALSEITNFPAEK